MRGIFFMALLMTLPLQAEVREFSRELTPSEEQGISYLINTLGGHSTLALGFYKKNLEEAGAQTDKVHPLRFFEYVLKNPQLTASIKKIKGIAWNKFTAGMVKNFKEASSNNNLTSEMIATFIKETGVKEEPIKTELDDGRYVAFMNTVRSGK